MTLRAVTVVLALWYFLTAAVHAGLLPIAANAGTAAAIVETVLGLVLLATLPRIVRPPLAGYVVATLGTVFGLTIVITRGLGGFDVATHLVMLAGLALGFVLIFRGRTRPT